MTKHSSFFSFLGVPSVATAVALPLGARSAGSGSSGNFGDGDGDGDASGDGDSISIGGIEGADEGGGGVPLSENPATCAEAEASASDHRLADQPPRPTIPAGSI